MADYMLMPKTYQASIPAGCKQFCGFAKLSIGRLYIWIGFPDI